MLSFGSNDITDSENGINWIKTGDADGTRYISLIAERIISEGVKKSRMVNAEDLILSNSMGFVHWYKLKINRCIRMGDSSCILTIQYLMLYTCISTQSLRLVYAMFKPMVVGVVVINLNSEIVKGLPAVMPSIEYQEQFAAFARQSDKSKNCKFTYFLCLNRFRKMYKIGL